MIGNALEKFEKTEAAVQEVDIVRGCLNTMAFLMGDVSKGKNLDDIQCLISNMEKRLGRAIGLIGETEIF